MIRRLPRRAALVVLALVSLAAAGVVWRMGERHRLAQHRFMWQATEEILAGETVELLRSHAALARFIGAVIPLTGLGDRFAETLNMMVRQHPDIRAVVISDGAGRTLLEVRPGEPTAQHTTDDGLHVVQSLASARSSQAARGVGRTVDQESSRGPFLIRTSEASSLPAMVGVAVDNLAPGSGSSVRVTILTLGADMPSTHAVIDRVWLVGHDDAVMAEPGLVTKPGASAQTPGLDWSALRRADTASGVLRLQMADGPHEVMYRTLDPWPATLVIDIGHPARSLTDPHGLAALLLCALAAASLWHARKPQSGQAGADALLSRANQVSDTRDGATRRLAAGVAHTINNVLTVLALDAEMVGAAATDDGMRVLSRSMLGATAQGTQLTRQLLSYAERAVLRPVVLDLERELQQRRDRLQSALDPGQTLASQIWDSQTGGPTGPDTSRLLVRADPDALETCLIALLRNAADVTPSRGEIMLELELLPLPGGDMVALVVDDSGPGMSAATLAEAMRPGFTTPSNGVSTPSDGQRDTGSAGRHLGLGLAAAQGFARQSGGRLLLHSTSGLGTQARLLLPLVRQEDQDIAGPAPGPIVAAMPWQAAGTHPPPARLAPFHPAPIDPAPIDPGLRRPKRILLVEDSAPVRDSIARRLRADGYDVVDSVDLAEVLALVARGVDVIITDIVLSDAIDGWTLAARAREISPMVPVVFMSGFMSSRQPELLAGDDLASFVRKPVDGTELQTVILGLLALHETRLIQNRPHAARQDAVQARP